MVSGEVRRIEGRSYPEGTALASLVLPDCDDIVYRYGKQVFNLERDESLCEVSKGPISDETLHACARGALSGYSSERIGPLGYEHRHIFQTQFKRAYVPFLYLALSGFHLTKLAHSSLISISYDP